LAPPASGTQQLGEVRILVITDQLRRRVPGGIGTYVRGLALGIERLVEREGDLGVETCFRPSRLPPSLPFVPTRLWRMALPGGFDVLHAPALPAPSGHTPTVVTVHDVAWRELPDAYPAHGRRWHERALAWAVERAAAIVVPSTPVAEALVAGGVPGETITVVPEGADHLPVPDAPRAAATRRQLGVEGPYLLTVSTIEPRKNLPRLLEAHARARSNTPTVPPLVVVGPEGWGHVRAAARDARFVGAVASEALAALYAGAVAFVYVPLTEGFGLPPLEAMTFGIPVVASRGRVPSVAGAALEVDPCSVGELADALVAVTTDAGLAARLAVNGKEHARRFTWAGCAAAHLELWRRVAGKGCR
jgi:glycosyltransferase involved in cell wall biosynthesis